MRQPSSHRLPERRAARLAAVAGRVECARPSPVGGSSGPATRVQRARPGGRRMIFARVRLGPTSRVRAVPVAARARPVPGESSRATHRRHKYSARRRRSRRSLTAIRPPRRARNTNRLLPPAAAAATAAGPSGAPPPPTVPRQAGSAHFWERPRVRRPIHIAVSDGTAGRPGRGARSNLRRHAIIGHRSPRGRLAHCELGSDTHRIERTLAAAMVYRRSRRENCGTCGTCRVSDWREAAQIWFPLRLPGTRPRGGGAWRSFRRHHTTDDPPKLPTEQ